MKEFIKKNKKIIGYIDHEKKIYFSPRTRKHEFRIFSYGFGLSVSLIDYLDKCGIDKVMIVYENKKVYCASLDSFIVKGKDWNDNGDKQLILEGQYWKEDFKRTDIQVKL